MNVDEMKAYRMREATRLIEQRLPLSKWNFRESARFFDNNTHPALIYDSEKCRVKAVYVAIERYEDHVMLMHYGRLGIPNSARVISGITQGSDYGLLWHNVNYALDFLEGQSPQDAARHKAHRFVTEFEQSETAIAIKYDPERTLAMHAMIWETYGDQLFDIFDSRNMELWNKYSTFVKEYWESIRRP